MGISAKKKKKLIESSIEDNETHCKVCIYPKPLSFLPFSISATFSLKAALFLKVSLINLPRL